MLGINKPFQMAANIKASGYRTSFLITTCIRCSASARGTLESFRDVVTKQRFNNRGSNGLMLTVAVRRCKLSYKAELVGPGAGSRACPGPAHRVPRLSLHDVSLTEIFSVVCNDERVV